MFPGKVSPRKPAARIPEIAEVTTKMDAARELAVFLRDRRERTSPVEAAGPAGRRRSRRTPGLRREEVAELACVSVDYVIRVEQGRLHPSSEVLDALALALRLSPDERAYLFDLARLRPTAAAARARVDHGSVDGTGNAHPLARLVHDLSPLPAMLFDHRFDILAWNPEMAGLMQLDFGALPDRQRNTLWLCVLHPALLEFYRDREQILREGIADLRAAWGAHPDDPSLIRLVDDLTTGSAEFARLWAMRDVRVNGRGRKRLQHGRLGPVCVEFEVLCPMQDPDQRLVIYRAGDAPSRSALETIAREASLKRNASPASVPAG